MLGKQCVVETHSEHLVNRLRQRVAAAEGDEVSKLIRMYFVEAVNGKSVYKPVVMNEYGSIPAWPKGFFDEAEELAVGILKASMEKRKRLQGETRD